MVVENEIIIKQKRKKNCWKLSKVPGMQTAFAEVNDINPKALTSQQAHDAHSLLLHGKIFPPTQIITGDITTRLFSIQL